MKRFENGLQTTNVTSNPLLERHTDPDLQLERAQYKGTNVMDRRYPVVDVEHGSVLAIATFRRDGADTPPCCSPRSSRSRAASCARFAP
jgi:hypothetical protein